MMVQRVGDNRVLIGEEGFEHTAVRIEAGGVKDRIFGAEIVGDRFFELLVDVLRAADKAHRRHAVAVRIHRPFRRIDQPGVVRQPEVIVRAKVEHFFTACDRDVGLLRRSDNTFLFVQSSLFDRLELGREVLFHFSVHGVILN